MLRARDLSKSFGELPVLRKVSLDIELGCVSVVIGPSGAGKTSLLRALAMLEPADSGSLEIAGVSYEFPDCKVPPPWPLLTVVFQQFFLWPHLTAKQNIELPLRYREGVPSAERERLIGVFELTDVINRLPHQLSIGQQQRVALIRALALAPKYLLLDEITSALDVEQASVILRCIADLKTRGLSVLVVTHHLEFARSVGDSVYFMEDGSIIEHGPSAILDHPNTPRLRQFLSTVDWRSLSGN
jgi:polar amino acid transport system ATP-binding protein